MTTKVLDVSGLPSFAFGQRGTLWWATMGMIAIEGTAFALMIAAYIFLRWRVTDWPPGYEPPDLLWGTMTTIIILISAIPNALAKKAAEKLDVAGARLWIWVSVVMAIVFCISRALEFTALNCRWDGNAYASIVWLLMGTHTTHVVTDIIDTAVLAGYTSSSRVDANRLVDVSENAGYYYFVIITWLPIYGLIYFAPRLV